jgi:hypothetical protein
MKHLARILMYSLKEEQLQARVRGLLARLRHMEEGEEYDKAFAQLTQLQADLANTRREKPGALSLQ